ncbi:PREDICTED: growth arrest-specific protein 1-like [Ceratosolen solmsi marchali]|uniref:Growth arrest-specific protein 1-like n=1 Tax=Ceratosolen solmsi marchali TaxID=326594 RepID=A0AAJ6YIE7_9HYME|nr:PREDICTED: growth arrest-specific protein 1-like [Ceratosolen solmsi marchali]
MSRRDASSWLDTRLLTIWLLLALALLGHGARAAKLPSTALAVIVPAMNATEDEPPRNATMPCNEARLKCAFRTGCGRALQFYLTHCASQLQGDVSDCPEICQYALIGLMSTDQGKELMTCDCAKDDVLCTLPKSQVEICRASVTTMMNRTRLSCRAATSICNADVLCSTALQYYNENCKRMFLGKKCTKRCRNSMNILRRQEKAAKLNTCFCDGAEEYDCNAIHRNMDELCFNKPPQQHHNYHEEQQFGAGGSSGGGGPGSSGDPRTNRIPSRGGPTRPSASWAILLLGLVLQLRSMAREE